MIQWIRRCFCKHEFELIQKTEHVGYDLSAYMCKHCGWIRRIKTQNMNFIEIYEQMFLQKYKVSCRIM